MIDSSPEVRFKSSGTKVNRASAATRVNDVRVDSTKIMEAVAREVTTTVVSNLGPRPGVMFADAADRDWVTNLSDRSSRADRATVHNKL
ncbi:hypothetical protein GN958_ATG23156 [Phytophthora infestans]|uniref:Uncharacterized protein n=1 Tax=Phytophthora infestans TaxID=4787 RepID=A0A8S9THJ0_PHYIN|nr:hypothetical protein GN958_ATG23156 [Phytophthora infestans]